jgi:hypothetical protein
VPSTGSSDTGSASPSPRISGIVTRRANSVQAVRGAVGAGTSASPSSVAGTSTRCICASVASIARQFCSAMRRPLRP